MMKRRKKIYRDKKKQAIEIHLTLFLFVAYMMFVAIADIICFLFHQVPMIAAYIVSILTLLLLYWLIRKKIKIVKEDFSRVDIIFFMILIAVMALRIAIPDSSYDTLNYHLYLQENPFANNTTENYFPGRWVNTFSFPLADRMHYFFREILGYRLGMICNMLCLMVVYYQVKRLLVGGGSRFIKNKSSVWIPIAAIVIIITEQIMTNMTTYYVDLFAIPLFLEIIIILFSKEKNEYNNYFVLLLAGFAISMKLSNLILVAVLAVIYIYKYRDTFSWKTFVFGIPILFFPVAVYMINNAMQTGNPIFPFYNAIFQSPYMDAVNWTETGYGPKTLKERLLWPLYTIRDTRRCFDTETYYGRIAFGYLTALVAFVIAGYDKIKRKIKFDQLGWMSILLIVLCLVWSNFMMGYIRYALILEILSGVVCVWFIYKYFNDRLVYSALSMVVILSLMYTATQTISDLMKTSNEISWRLPFGMNEESYMNNARQIFNRDYNYNDLLDGVSCIGITDFNSGYARLLTDEIPIIDIHMGYENDYGKEQMEKVLQKCENIYTISTDLTYDRTKKYIEKVGFEETGKVNSGKVEFLNNDYNLQLIEITRSDE